MGWPSPPYPFGNATSPEAMAYLDNMFNQSAAMMSVPCSASGTNAISLTPLTNCPALSAYAELGGYRFRAVATSTNLVTIQYNGLAFLNAYHADGVTQASISDLVIGEQYIVTYSASLNGGLGGFFLESPSVTNAATTWFTPGGRLTFISGQPVMFSNVSSAQNIYYAPYIHPFVPIYNGTSIQMYQFTSSLSDQVGLTLAMGGSANFPTGTNFDIFAFLLAGVPTLGTFQWTNQTTRNITLGVFGGFLTNAGALANIRYSASASALVPINQATFLGTFATGYPGGPLGGNGQSAYVFGSAASGGGSANFYLCNYYNKILQNTIVTDSGAGYSYTSATTRQARASTGNQIVVVQSDSERAIITSYNSLNTIAGALGANQYTGIGINTLTTFNALGYDQNNTAVAIGETVNTSYQFSATGLVTIAALERADGTNASTFDAQSTNQLMASIWL
jgi:hypothetical protein